MKKISLLLLTFTLMMSLLIGCANDNEDNASNEDSLNIAYLTPGLDLPFWKYLSEGIKAEAEKEDVKVQVYDSKNDSDTQLKNAQDAITKQVDALILSPTDSSTAPAVLRTAEEADIPVIIADIGTDSGNYESFITSQNKEGSKEVGDYLVEYLKEKGQDDGAVAQVTISLSRKNGKDRTGGFEEAMDNGNIEIADVKQLEDYTRSEAKRLSEDLITGNTELRGIFGQTDEPALGVLKAVESQDKLDDIAVVGFDATPETIEAIRDGKMLAAAVQQPVKMGKESFEVALDVINGNEVEEEILIPTLLVTKDNADDDDIKEQLKENVFPEQ